MDINYQEIYCPHCGCPAESLEAEICPACGKYYPKTDAIDALIQEDLLRNYDYYKLED